MSLVDWLPGTKPDRRFRNAVVVVGYGVVIVGLLLTITTLPVFDGAGPGQSDTEAEPVAGPDSTDSTDDRDGEKRAVSEEELLLLYETRVEQWGVELHSVERSEDVLSVDYNTTATTNDEIIEEMSYLVGSYVDIVEDGFETDRMGATAIEPDDGVDRASWHVESDWASAYTAGELSEEELLELVLETVEVAD